MPADMIVLQEFCRSHHLEVSFIQSLEEHGLIEITLIDEILYVPAHELPRLEKITRLYQELHINPEGIDAIDYLLQKIEAMQHEITELRNRLTFFEENL